MTRWTSDPGTWSLFILLSLIWGSSYLFIKIGLDEGVAPLTLVAIRTILGTAILGVVMVLQRARLPRTAGTWARMAFVGMTNIVIPYALITWGELHISSGMAGILTAMVPLFTVVLASLLLHDEPVTAARVSGLSIGFIGVVLLAWPSLESSTVGGDAVLPVAGMAAVGLATLSYAVAVVYTRHRLTGQPVMLEADGTRRAPTPLEISFGQVLTGMLVVSVIALLLEQPGVGSGLPASTSAIAAMLWLGLLGTGIAYLLFFALIARWGATRAALVAYVMPLVAIVLGFLVLDERLQPIEFAGAALIISGVIIVNGSVGQRPLFARRRAT